MERENGHLDMNEGQLGQCEEDKENCLMETTDRLLLYLVFKKNIRRLSV